MITPSLKFWLLRFDAKVLFECDYVFLSNTDTKWLYIEIYHVKSFISLQANHLVIHVTIIKLKFSMMIKMLKSLKRKEILVYTQKLQGKKIKVRNKLACKN